MPKINRERYVKVTNYFKYNRKAYFCLSIVYRALPLLVFASYPMLLLYVFIIRETQLLLKFAAVPAAVFAGVTVLRAIIKEERPYTRYEASPVFVRRSGSYSMPSRHTASAFVIAMTFLRANVWLGSAFVFIAVLIAASRVLAGVHYVRDVAAGALISVTAGVVFLFLF